MINFENSERGDPDAEYDADFDISNVVASVGGGAATISTSASVADDVFIRICAECTSATPHVREHAARLLGWCEGMGEHLLLQAFSKKPIREFREAVRRNHAMQERKRIHALAHLPTRVGDTINEVGTGGYEEEGTKEKFKAKAQRSHIRLGMGWCRTNCAPPPPPHRILPSPNAHM